MQLVVTCDCPLCTLFLCTGCPVDVNLLL